MTVMSLATYRPEVFQERAKAIVLVATAATAVGLGGPATPEFAAQLIASPFVTRALQSKNGHLFVRGVVRRSTGASPHGADPRHLRQLRRQGARRLRLGVRDDGPPRRHRHHRRADDGDGRARATRSRVPKKADQMVATIPGSRLVTLKDKGHMLPLEDPDAVTDEIVRAVKG